MIRPKNRGLKARARKLLEGQYGFLVLITFILMMAQYFLNAVIDYAFPSTSTTGSFLYFACSLLSNILYVILLAGAYKVYLNRMRGLPIQQHELFFAFSNQPEQVAIYALVRFVISFGFTKTLDWFINEVFSGSPSFPILIDVLIFLLITAIVIWLHLSFSLTLYLYCDEPWRKAPELIKESNQLMNGNRGRLLLLNLSFVGISILGVLSLGIGMLFIEPYLNMTLVLFYEDLTGAGTGSRQESESASSENANTF